MTLQALALLRKLKKVQRVEGGTIWIDQDNNQISTVIAAGQKSITVDLSKNWGGFMPTVDYLVTQGLITRQGPENIQLLHNGFFYRQEIASAFFRFMISSVLVPIAVALITTLASLWFTGVFTATPQ